MVPEAIKVLDNLEILDLSQNLIKSLVCVCVCVCVCRRTTLRRLC